MGKPSQRYYGILTFSASFLFLLRRIVFLSPFSLLDMQPIQHRPPATNAPGLFRHIIDAAISPLFTRAHLYTVAGAVRPAGGVAYFVRDGKLRSPNPLCALRSQTPALRLSGSTEPVIPSLKGGVPHRFLSYPRQYYQAQRRPFCRCRSCLPQRNQADK